MSSLRSSGYDNYQAIEDIIDNSIDAGAKQIKVFAESHQNILNRIIIADNGSGMDAAILDEALKLGSLIQKDENSDLGKFGMGLITASISIAKKLEVITKIKDGDFLYASQDLDEIETANEFEKEQRKANEAEIAFFKDYISCDAGTIVVLTKIDRPSDKNTTQFSTKLAKDIGRIYRKFLQSGTSIEVNSKRVTAIDPLWRDKTDKPEIFSEEEYDIPESIADKTGEKIKVVLAILPEHNEEVSKADKINIINQGFYILRNNREIAYGEALGLFTKHNDFNRLRGEISFSAKLDRQLGIKFSKVGVSLNDELFDFLNQNLGAQLRTIRNRLKEKKAAADSETLDHKDSEMAIAQKAKLLTTPDAIIEKRAPKTQKTEREESKNSAKERININKTQTLPGGITPRFVTVQMKAEGPIYSCEQQGKTIIIQWNSDHPFYQKMMLANRDDKNIVSALDYLVFALASAELRLSANNEEHAELVSNLKTIVSSNLRVLLS
jgi:hypothetical protein